MTYKQQIKQKECELYAKIRIIRYVKKEHIPNALVANAFSTHRNTISNILQDFETLITHGARDRLLNGTVISTEAMQRDYAPLGNKTRKPSSHKKAATKEQADKLTELFMKGKKVGAKRMMHLIRKYFQGGKADTAHLTELTIGQIRGILKRRALKTEQVRSVTGQKRHLYDYENLRCFEKLHYDVKYIQDSHALPSQAYRALSGPGVPRYEWNILDAKSRFRFMAFSYRRPRLFGFVFLLFVILYLRLTLVSLVTDILCGVDRGMEFCGGLKQKERQWNRILLLLHAGIYSYNPTFDIIKNLIERSHRSDDEEWLIPHGSRMGTKELFLPKGADYWYYWNFERVHSGLGMFGRTPFEVLQQSGLTGTEALLGFPVLILDDVILQLQEYIFMQFGILAKKDPFMQNGLEEDPSFLLTRTLISL